MTDYTITQINLMDRTEFTTALGEIFERTPEIAAQCWHLRPFANTSELHLAMTKIVDSFNPEAKLKLICAHPDLGSKLKMAESSVKEQAGAGLDRLEFSEYTQLISLNQNYHQKFGFPFIVAVKDYTKSEVLQIFGDRIGNSHDLEQETALTQIKRIAWHRIHQLIIE